MSQRKSSRRKTRKSPFSKSFLFKSCYFIPFFYFIFYSNEKGKKTNVAFLDEYFNSLQEIDSASYLNAGEKIEKIERPKNCSYHDLLKIRHQLPPELCILDYAKNKLFYQRCSLTTATKCPKATWLEEYYQELQKIDSTNHSMKKSKHFLGISIGCNKGFDAIHTLRMGTYNDQIHKDDWKSAMESKSGKLHLSVCEQDSASDMFGILPAFQSFNKHFTKTSPSRPKGEMHCVEPMPKTFQSLEFSSKFLNYNKYGFHVTNAAISKESGTMYFPSGTLAKSGVENQGLATCMNHMTKKQRIKYCSPVGVFSLNDFVEKKIKSKGPINILSIDVEGFDCDVISGATKEVLKRVEYLEFEYNWMGSWAKVHLLDVIEMLHEIGFTCYWAGIDLLWRITNCWLSFYDIHVWSNVACVNRIAVPVLARKMEQKFKSTLENKKQWISKPGAMMGAKKLYQNHDLMSLELQKLTQRKYLIGKRN